MLKMKPLVVAIALVGLTHSVSAPAQLADPSKTRSTTQVAPPPTPAPPARQIAAPPPPLPVRQIDPVRPPPPTIPSTLGQRDTAAPVQAGRQTAVPAQQSDAQRIGATPAKVYDRNGRALNGMEQAGPNRVRDTQTGRYYNTVPQGDGQRIGP